MTHDEMLLELERLNAIVARPIGEQDQIRRQAFLAELERRFLWLKALEWKAVMTHVIDHHKTRALPTLEEFSKAVDALRARGAVKKFEACKTCLGDGLVTGRYRRMGTTEIVDAARPCPSCRATMAWEIHPDLEPVTDDEARDIRTAKALTPEQARMALVLLERAKVKMPDTLLLILVERSKGPLTDREERTRAKPVADLATASLFGVTIVKPEAKANG